VVALDGLRFVAALMVVVYHYIGYGGYGPGDGGAWGRSTVDVFPGVWLPASFGWLGVELFFLISGFVICMSSWGRGLADFFVSRAARLYPAYWAAVLLTTAVLTIWPVVRKPGQPQDVLVNLTMLQQPLGVPLVDAVYWTLWAELRFYLLFAVVVYFGVNYRRVVLFCALWTVASVLAPAADSKLLNLVVMPVYAPYFIAGIALYLIYRFGSTLMLWGIVAISWLLAQHHLVWLHREAASWLHRELPGWVSLLVVTASFAAVAAVALGWLSWMNWRWLTVAGATTYPLYLLHEYIGWTVIYHLRDEVPPWPLVGGVVAGMILLSYLVYRLVEKPIGKLLRRTLTKATRQVRAEIAALDRA
jgi:peptidoglycan/LPS O-acetylase OafA/YrhL